MENRTFDQTGDFEAYNAAEEWLKSMGYSIGSMQREAPVGFKKGDYDIAKWRNLDDQDKALLDGVIEGESKRNGPITVTFYNKETV